MAGAASLSVKLSLRICPTERPRQFEPLLAMTWVIQISRIILVEGHGNPLLSPDSGTHCNAFIYRES
jgi:hypothetical protein